MKVKLSRWLSCLLLVIGVGIILMVVLSIGALVILSKAPSIGAYGADFLRKVIGDQAVADLETVLFKFEDAVKNAEYQLGMGNPISPWAGASPVPLSTPVATKTFSGTSTPAGSGTPIRRGTPSPSVTPTVMAQTTSQGTEIPPTQPTVENTVTPTVETAWVPPDVTPLGNLKDVGVWQPYIQDQTGRIVAYRTFLQPDPQRPYTLTGIVAFDLVYTRLHFQLGSEEPYAPNVKARASGKIPDEYKVPGILLAAFNGGFQMAHGHFGAMGDRLISVPPTDGLATIAFYDDGHIQMGEWGSEIKLTPDMFSFRQNGPSVIHNGEVNKLVSNPDYWGHTIYGGTVAWRSGIALSQDGRILYYFAGPYLTINTLADAMAAVHPQNAMQLDINNFWVHFTIFHAVGNRLIPEALFPKDMTDRVNRFLNAYVRDFFYVTVIE